MCQMTTSLPLGCHLWVDIDICVLPLCYIVFYFSEIYLKKVYFPPDSQTINSWLFTVFSVSGHSLYSIAMYFYIHWFVRQMSYYNNVVLDVGPCLLLSPIWICRRGYYFLTYMIISLHLLPWTMCPLYREGVRVRILKSSGALCYIYTRGLTCH